MDEASSATVGDSSAHPPAPPAAPLAATLLVSRSLEDNHPRLDVRGALTARTVPLLAATLDPLTRVAVPDVRVVLGQVSELTFAAATTLLRLERRLRRTGGRLVLCDPSAVVARLLTETGLARHFRFDPPLEQVK